MSLPSGYKRLLYIKSTGIQYNDTGFKPDQNTRIVCRSVLEVISNTANWLYGARYSTSSKMFGFVAASMGYYRAYFGNTIGSFDASLNTTSPFILDQNKNVTTFNGGSSVTNTMATFSTPVNLALFAANTNGTIAKGKASIYSCQIYDNGNLVRDFIPCQKPDGTIGLWDDVNSVFYANAGTGTFTAGPVVIAIPGPPSNLHQTMAVRLAWAAVSGAERYNVYRDGTLLATTTDLAYVDGTAAENQEYTYGVSAVNSAGESPKTTIPIYTKSGYFLYRPVVESATFQ